MGKKRLQQINEIYGPNEKNLNPNNSVEREVERATKNVIRKHKQQTMVNRKVRKIAKKIRKVTDHAAAKARRRIALVNDGSQDKMSSMLTEGLKKVDDFLNSLPVATSNSDHNSNKTQKEVD